MSEVKKNSFNQSTSILRRLKIIMIAIAFFVVINFLALFFSSRGFLDGMQDIKRANSILTLTSQSIASLEVAEDHLENLTLDRKLSDIKMGFKESQRIITKAITTSIYESRESPELLDELSMGYSSLESYQQSVKELFQKYSFLARQKGPDDLEKLSEELLIVQQYAMETKEHLRKAQILIRKNTDGIFNSIYEKRMTPLIVTVFFSLAFFSFVVIFGFSIARRIGRSVNNLIDSTEVVASGDFSHIAPIFENDEIGRLTFDFNNMVKSLDEGQKELRQTLDRIRSLQLITASFSEALTVDEVCEVTLKSAFKPLGATAGSLGLISEDKSNVEIIKRANYADEIADKWKIIKLADKTPMTEAIKKQEGVFLKTRHEISTRFPVLNQDLASTDIHSMCTVPLMIGGLCLGSLSLTFKFKNDFSQEEKDFIVAIATQCAQALQRSHLYDDARKAILARDEFLSIASHELKTPLTPLKLQLQMLARQIRKNDTDSFNSEKVIKIIESSDKQMERLSKLIEDLLDVSRITSGKLNLNLEKVNLGEMIKEVMVQYGNHLKDAVNKVEVLSAPHIEGYVDKIRLEQVLINLLTNAAKYAPGKSIKVSLEASDKHATIKVKDEGPGISNSDQARIFNRFERVKDNQNIGGLGLGLYISHQIVAAHEGQIWVESVPGQGSTFVIQVPLKDA